MKSVKMFGLFKKHSPESTAKLMAEAYKKSLNYGENPKMALVSVYRVAASRQVDLARIPPQTYFTQVHQNQYTELSDSPDEAKPFVVAFIINFICAYLHPEVSTMDLSPFSSESQFEEYQKRNEIKDSLESLILENIG